MNRFDRARLDRVLSWRDGRRYARWALPRPVFDYVDGGSEDEVTLARNRDAFRRLAWMPRTGIWTPEPDLSRELLGEQLSMPLLTAPCGGLKLVHPEADVGVARAAADAGTVHVVSSVTSGFSLEDIAREVSAPKWFQLYRFHASRAGMESLVERAQAAGYRALVATVDTSVAARRERDVRNGFTHSMRPNLGNALRLVPQMAPRPLWVSRYIRDGMPFDMANTAGLTHDGRPMLLSEMGSALESHSPSWDDLEWVRANWRGPLLVKGIMNADDARRVAQLGCDGIIVSNHGGRQLDGLPATIDVLPGIAAAVGSDLDVLLDSGVRRGSDVLKALALGAKAVLVGRAYVWGLALAGQAGVRHVLELFRREMVQTMQLLGCASIDDLDPTWLATASPSSSE